jgi:hypothetical protein
MFDPAPGFDSKTVAGIINTIEGRQQMVWFMGWAVEWSASSNFLQHAHIHWMTRGLCKPLTSTTRSPVPPFPRRPCAAGLV